MTTECNQFVFGFHPLKRLEIRAQFDGGAISTDGGGLLLREVEKRIGILRQFASCFTDYRNPDLIEHTVEELVAQIVYGLAVGYEDLNDHEELRNACWWRSSSKITERNRKKSSWTWTLPTIRYTGSRKGVSSMATMGIIATCRCTSSAESSCCVRDCERRTSMPQQEV